MARRLEIEIVGNSRDFEKALGKASSASNGFGSAVSKMGKAATLAATAGFAVIGAGAVKAVGAAVNLGESVNAVNVVFGKASKQLHEFGAKAATEAGLSMRAFNELVTPVGASLQNVGFSADQAAKASINLGKRAADMASVFNVDVSEAMTAIQAGLRGEADPLERFGVGLSDAAVKAQAMAMGLAKTEKELSANDKAQARLALLMSQTNKVAGDFVNTSDSLANQQRILKAQFENIAASVGSALVPVLSRAVAGIGEFVTKFQAADGLKAKVQVVMEGAQSLVKDMAQLGSTAGKLIGKAMSEVDWTATANMIATALGSALKAGIPKALDLAASIAAGFLRAVQEVDWVTVGAAIGKGIKDGTIRGAKDFVRDGGLKLITEFSGGPMVPALKAVGHDMGQHLVESLGKNLRIGIPSKLATVPTMIQRGVDPAIAVAVSSGSRIGSGLAGGLTAALTGVSASVAATIISQIHMSELQIKQKYGIHSPSTVWAERIGKPLGEGVVMGLLLGTAALPEKMKESLQRAIEAGRSAIEGSRGKLADAFGGAASDALSAFDAIQGGIQTKTEKLLAKLTAARSAADRAGAVTDARSALKVAQAGTDGSVDSAAVASAQKALDEALWAQREFGLQQRIIQERRELDAKITMRRRDLESALATLGERLAKEGAKAATASEAVIKLLGKYGVNFKAVGAEMGSAWIAGLKETIEGAAKGAGALAGTITKAAGGINVPGRAVGGPVAGGQPYVVGERGPEVFVPGRSGTVVPNVSGGGSRAGGWGGPQVIQLILDRKVLAELVRNENGRYIQINGAA